MFSLFIKVPGVGVVLNPGILTRVMRAAARDHAERDLIARMQDDFQWALKRDRNDPHCSTPAHLWRSEFNYECSWGPIPRCRGGWPMVRVEEVTVFDTPYGDGSVASVEVTYDHDGGMARALYGVYGDGVVACWAN